MSTTRVGLYARISEDPNDTRAGVDRQRADALAIAKVRHWEVSEEYVDNDLSAYKRKVKRPRFEQMLADLTSGHIDGIVAYDLDRFVRQPRDLERAIDIYEDRKGLVFATAQGDINLQTADGRTMARVMVAFANKSSADTGRRVQRAHLDTAKKGKPVGGYRPFGWKADRATLDPKESAAVREAVAGILSGRALRAVCRQWNEAGLLTTAGAEWKPATLRQYLKNPRLVGYRTYRREVLLDDHGRPVQGLWESLLSVDEWERVVRLLEKPERRSRVPRRDARHYFLTGLLRCGRCNGVMYGNARGGTHYYACRQADHTNSISGEGADEAVGKLVLAMLAGVEGEAQPEQWAGEQQLAEVVEQIDQLMSAFMAKQLSGDVVFPRVQALEEERDKLKEGRSQWLVETTGPALEEVSPDEWENALDNDAKRAYAEKVLDAVMVAPPTQRGNQMQVERLVPVARKRSDQRSLYAVPS